MVGLYKEDRVSETSCLYLILVSRKANSVWMKRNNADLRENKAYSTKTKTKKQALKRTKK